MPPPDGHKEVVAVFIVAVLAAPGRRLPGRAGDVPEVEALLHDLRFDAHLPDVPGDRQLAAKRPVA